MSTFEILMLVGLGFIALGLFAVASGLDAIRKDVSEIWKRMKRLD